MNTKRGVAGFNQALPRKSFFSRLRRYFDTWRVLRDIAQTQREYKAGKCKEFTTAEEVLKMDI